jgi:lipopolysaccharide/colanic/teichoic acid biosynthesis glycosyltransferase
MIAGLPSRLLQMSPSPHNWSQLRVKRAFDIAGSLLMLAVLSPLCMLIITLVKLQTGGSVFATTRTKYYGHEVSVLRFAGEKCGEITNRFLAHSGADFIPSLLNVIRGELSIIGPNFQTNAAVPPRYLEALRSSPLKPGLLGPKFTSGAAEFGLSRLEADYLYVSRWSFWLDVRILYSHLFPKQPTFTDRQAW